MKVHREALKHLLHRVGITIVNRSVGSDARTHLIEKFVAHIVLHNLVDEILSLGSVAHERHIALQDIPQLREFVKVVVTKEASDGRKSGILLLRKDGRAVFCVLMHGAELVNIENFTTHAHTLLRENRISVALRQQYDVDNEEEGAENDETYERTHKVETALHGELPRSHVHRNQCRIVSSIMRF